MKIAAYDPKYKEDFIAMNKAWISEMFVLEAEDVREFENIEPSLAKGGQIFFALSDNSDVIACCMIAPRSDGDWEIMKFAAKEGCKGCGAGSACLETCIDYARKLRLPKVIIISNRKCEAAVHLYFKHGFREIPVDKERFPFERVNIAFEKALAYDKI